MKLSHWLCLVGSAVAGLRGAPLPPELPTPGQVRVVCGQTMVPVVERWIALCRERMPKARFTVRDAGSDIALASLFCGRCDLAIVGRRGAPPELKAFEWVYHYPAACTELMTGGWNQPGQSAAVGVFVSAGNPLDRLSLGQLANVLNAAGETELPSTWGELGVTGNQSTHPIHFYLPASESGTGRYLRAAVLHDSRKLRWGQVAEFDDTWESGSTRQNAGQKTLTALKADPDGLAIAALPESWPAQTKLLALSGGGGNTAVLPSAATVAARTYPLSRPVFGYYHPLSSVPPNPALRELLRWALSPTGQAEVARVSRYAPLPPNLKLPTPEE